MDRDQLTRIALRYDTAMSRAMLRALGLLLDDVLDQRDYRHDDERGDEHHRE